MNESSEIQKICPSCNQPNKADDMYCRNCGASLEGVAPVKIKGSMMPATSETNKVQFTENLKGWKYCFNCCALVMFILILTIIIIPMITVSWGIAITVIIAIFLLPIGLCFFIQMLRFTSPMGPSRTISISDQEIRINFPKKPPFKIKWSEFDTVQLYKYSPDYYDMFPVGMSIQAYKIRFLSNDVLKAETSIELARDFSSRTAKRVRALMEQYATRLNKEYIWGKNIQKVRRKRQKKKR